MITSAFPSMLLFLTSLVSAKTVSYNWDVTWVTAAPDGFARAVIGVNGKWPCPPINADVGDTVVVTLNNLLGNETTGLHFHGIRQLHTNDMDGNSGATQCPVPPGSSITYKFLADSPGTYWYHSHNMGQYPDGFRGPLIVHDPNDPYKGEYDEELILTISDWYHDQAIFLVQNMLQASNTDFSPPFPESILVNDGQSSNFNFVKGKTYRIRIISYSAFASSFVYFDSHTLQVISIDATYIQEAEATQLRVSPSQRVDVLISALDEDQNYPYLVALDTNKDFTKPGVFSLNFTGHVVTDCNKPATGTTTVGVWHPVDDSYFIPLDKADRYEPVDRTIVLDFEFCRDENDIPRACFNGQPYISQKVPTLYSVATTGASNTDPTIYGDINPFVISYGEVVQIVINNKDEAIHPFHLHGHQFQVVGRPASGSGDWVKNGDYPAQPARRDVIDVMGNSHAVIRFEATNPGVFLFHCHIEWHVEMGLTATLIVAPDRLRDIKFPADHIHNCEIQDIPIAGNAAGSRSNFTSRTGFITVPDLVYTGSLYAAPASRSRVVKRLLE